MHAKVMTFVYYSKFVSLIMTGWKQGKSNVNFSLSWLSLSHPRYEIEFFLKTVALDTYDFIAEIKQNYVQFMSCSKCSNWCPISKLSSNFGCLFTFCYLDGDNSIKTDLHICNWPVCKVQVCNLVFNKFATAE